MIKTDARGPSLDELRPLGRPLEPALSELERDLLEAGDHPGDHRIAYAMAALATYAYSDVWTVANMASRLGLPGNYCRQLDAEVDVLFIRSHASMIQSADGRVVVLAYRGTTPTSAINWLGDLNIDPVPMDLPVPPGVRAAGDPTTVQVHRGFYRNVRATGWLVLRALDRALHGLPISRDEQGSYNPTPGGPTLQPMEALYVTGHSLGGAMAALAAVQLLTLDAPKLTERLRAIYTFGAPMVGDRTLAAFAGNHPLLADRLLRYVYAKDVVAQVPPALSGDFAHFGREFRCKARTKVWKASANTEQLRNPLEFGGLLPSFLAKQIEWTRTWQFPASLADHLPQYYLDALQPADVRTEFGD